MMSGVPHHCHYLSLDVSFSLQRLNFFTLITVYMHHVTSLFTCIMLHHCLHALCYVTVYMHYVTSLLTCIMLHHCLSTLCYITV